LIGLALSPASGPATARVFDAMTAAAHGNTATSEARRTHLRRALRLILVSMLVGSQASAQDSGKLKTTGTVIIRVPDVDDNQGSRTQIGGMSAGGVATASPSRKVIEKLLLTAHDERRAVPQAAGVVQMTRNFPDLDLVQSLDLFGETKLVGLLSFEAAKQDATTRELGFDSDTASAYGGFSFSLGRSGVLGLGAEISRVSGTLTDGNNPAFMRYRVDGGEFDSNSFAPSVYYSTSIADRAYLQLWSSYEFFDMDGSKHGAVLAKRVIGSDARFSVDGRELTLGAQTIFGLDAGMFAISPQLSLEFARQWTDASTEIWEPVPVEVRFDSDQSSSLQSAAGISAATSIAWRRITFQPRVTLDWIHEFLDGARTIDGRIDGRPIQFMTDAPDRDWLELSGEVSVSLANGVNAALAAEVELDHRNYRRATLYGGISIPLY
jgi:hypothetical protein